MMLQLEEMAKFLRERSQMAGISSPEPWNDISERRRYQWRRMATAFEGYCIAPIPLIKRVIEGTDLAPAYMGECFISDEDRVALKALVQS